MIVAMKTQIGHEHFIKLSQHCGWVGGWWLTRQSLTEWYSAHYIGHYILVITLAIRLCIHYDNSGSVAISCIRIFLERKNKCFDLIKGLNTGALFCGAGKLHLRDSIRRCVSKTGRKGLSVGGLALIGADQRKRLDPTVDEFPFPFIPPLTPTAWIVLL